MEHASDSAHFNSPFMTKSMAFCAGVRLAVIAAAIGFDFQQVLLIVAGAALLVELLEVDRSCRSLNLI